MAFRSTGRRPHALEAVPFFLVAFWPSRSFRGASARPMLLALAGLVLLLNLVSYWASAALGTGSAQLEKLAPFECGLEPFGSSPKFEILFYLVGLLYLVFDLELVLLFPLAAAAASLAALLSPFAFLAVLIFLAVLTLAFLFEWAVGALNVQSWRASGCPGAWRLGPADRAVHRLLDGKVPRLLPARLL